MRQGFGAEFRRRPTPLFWRDRLRSPALTKNDRFRPDRPMVAHAVCAVHIADLHRWSTLGNQALSGCGLGQLRRIDQRRGDYAAE